MFSNYFSKLSNKFQKVFILKCISFYCLPKHIYQVSWLNLAKANPKQQQIYITANITILSVKHQGVRKLKITKTVFLILTAYRYQNCFVTLLIEQKDNTVIFSIRGRRHGSQNLLYYIPEEGRFGFFYIIISMIFVLNISLPYKPVIHNR
jgi:hypothetical protein